MQIESKGLFSKMNFFSTGALRTGLLACCATLALILPAKADYAVWTDNETGLKVSFPDTWKQINNQQPDDVITLSLPSNGDEAVCRVRAREDRRFVIYPNRYRDEVRDINFATDYWKEYTSAYDNVTMVRQQNEAGLGQGFASMTLVSFTTPPTEPEAQKAGLMAVTNYGDKVYIAECTSKAEMYPDYHVPFLSFFKTISFKPAYSVTKVGNYRNFLKDWGTINVPLANKVSRSVY